MTKNVLLVGCSNLINKQGIWNEVVFDGQANITNLSFDGVGNYFISGNLSNPFIIRIFLLDIALKE